MVCGSVRSPMWLYMASPVCNVPTHFQKDEIYEPKALSHFRSSPFTKTEERKPDTQSEERKKTYTRSLQCQDPHAFVLRCSQAERAYLVHQCCHNITHKFTTKSPLFTIKINIKQKFVFSKNSMSEHFCIALQAVATKNSCFSPFFLCFFFVFCFFTFYLTNGPEETKTVSLFVSRKPV